MKEISMDKFVVYQDVLEKLELSMPEYLVMDFIDHMIGDRKDPFSRLRRVAIVQIAEWVHMSASYVTRIVEGLNKKGFIEKRGQRNSQLLMPTGKWYKAIKQYRETEVDGRWVRGET